MLAPAVAVCGVLLVLGLGGSAPASVALPWLAVVPGAILAAWLLLLAYGTGWAHPRRSLPFGGPGLVEVLLAWVLTWFHVDFAAAAAGVLAYRLFNFRLALIPAAAVLPFGRKLERDLARATKSA